MIDRNAKGARLAVNSKGTALLTYRARGRVQHVLAWGVVNARVPTRGVRQVAFRVDYSGGWGSQRRLVLAQLQEFVRPLRGTAAPVPGRRVYSS